MKTRPHPHEKLTDDEVKEMFHMLERNHDMMKECFNAYIEVHSKYMDKLAHHFFPERFSIGEVSMGELSDMFAKAYPSFSSGEVLNMKKADENDN